MGRLLSVAIPTFNRCGALKVTLENLINQIVKNNLQEEVEIVVSDNASIDETEALCNVLKDKYPKIFSYNKQQYNVGYGLNLRTLINISDSDYIWFCSDDDIYDESLCQTLVRKLKENAEVSVVHIASDESTIDALEPMTIRQFLYKVSWSVFALCSSCVFKLEDIKYIKPDKYIWYHLYLLFGLDLEKQCAGLPKLIDICTPVNDKNYWNCDFEKAIDTNTELIEYVVLNETDENIKRQVFNHYKACLHLDIEGYMSQSEHKKAETFAKRLKNLEMYREEYVYLTKPEYFKKCRKIANIISKTCTLPVVSSRKRRELRNSLSQNIVGLLIKNV